VALYVQILTNNRNRAASDVRSTISRHHGSLGEPGYLFDQKGVILARGEEDEVMLAALEAGAEDVVEAGDGSFEVVTTPSDLAAVRAALAEADVAIDDADVTQLPLATVPLDGGDARRLLRLIEALDDLDDVEAVFSNYDIDDTVMEQVLAEA
jgi:transcriptional/translational regulatory protein YebC/TACO1